MANSPKQPQTAPNTENPFYRSYIFSKADLNRAKIKKWHHPFLWTLPTYVQKNDGYYFYFKLWQDRVFIMKMILVKGE